MSSDVPMASSFLWNQLRLTPFVELVYYCSSMLARAPSKSTVMLIPGQVFDIVQHYLKQPGHLCQQLDFNKSMVIGRGH